MGWAAGIFSRIHDWQADESAGTNIEASRMDAEDDNFAAGINDCLVKDGTNVATADLPMGGFKHTGVGDGSAKDHYPAINQIQDGGFVYGVSSGTNTITLTLSPAITAYTAGQLIVFKAGGTNTGAVTLNVNGLGAKNVYNTGGLLGAGEINSGTLYIFGYDGTQFRILSANDYGDFATKVKKTSVQSINNVTNTAVIWHGEEYDYGDMWNSGAATRLTAPAHGIYDVKAVVGFANDSVGDRILSFKKNGATVFQANEWNPDGGNNSYVVMAMDYALDVGDYMEVWAYQDSTSSLNIVYTTTFFSMSRIRTHS